MRFSGLLGHKWGDGKYKQYCTRKGCLAVRWLMINPMPKIGEAQIDWEEIDITNLGKNLP